MRKESRNWKLVKDEDLFEFVEDSEYLLTKITFVSVKCEDCSSTIFTKEKWQAFLKLVLLLRDLVKVIISEQQQSSIVKNVLSNVNI